MAPTITRQSQIPKAGKRRFPLVPFNKIELATSPAFIVKDIIPAEALVVVYGKWKTGKSFWTFDIGMHIALGCTYRGHKVKPGAVIYIALEGARGLKARAEAFRQTYLAENDEKIPFFLLATRLDLIKETQALITEIQAQLPDGKCAVIFIDTLNRSLVGSESDDKDMTAYIQAADAVREALGSTVVVVHHTGHNTTRPRGHTSLLGALDALIAVEKLNDGTIVARVELLKDGQEGTEIRSRLKLVEVGIDDEGEVIKSCVIEPADNPTHPAKETPAKDPKTLTPTAQKFVTALSFALTANGKPYPELEEGIAVTLEQWKAECRRLGYLDPLAEGETERKSQVSYFHKYRRECLKNDRIRCNGDLVWTLK